MAETLTIRTASSTEVIKIAAPGPQGPKGDKGDPGDVAGLPLTTQGDTLYRGASQNERLPIGTSGQVLKVSAGGIPEWGNESGAVTSVNGETGAVVLDAADVGAAPSTGISPSAISGTAVVDSDPRLTDSRNPSSHSSSHASAGSDPLAPSSIGAQSLFSSGVITGASSPAAARAIIYDVMNFGSAYDITLPITNSLQGDIFVFRATNLMAANVTIKFLPTTGGSQAVGTLTAVGEQLRFTYRSSAQEWILVEVDSHPANRITSGTLTHERGGLEADVSAYNGLVKISGGSTSAVTVTSAGEALLDDADAAAQRTTLGLGTAATAATGDFAAASHSHGNINSSGQVGSDSGRVLVTTTAGAVTTLALGTANQVLRVNSGATAVEFADPAASGVTGAAASASDVLGVSGANITGVDANADRIIFWDDSASALKHLTVGSGLSLTDTTLTATGGGVTTGSVDNAIIRADGTGGSTSQSSDIVIDDATTSTQANVAIVNNHSETNSALVLTPKGTGAFIVGPKPDGTATGGNARGNYAIDLQLERTNANQIAGTNEVVIGTRNRGGGSNSVVIGTSLTTNTNNNCTVIGQSAQGLAAEVIVIGYNASASGSQAMSIGQSAASGVLSVSLGVGAPATLRGQFATRVFQAVYYGGQTTDATPTVLGLDAQASTNRFTIAANTALAVDILLVARRSDTQDKWLVARRFLGIRRDGSNNTSLIGSVQTIGTDQTDGSPTWSFTLTADDTNEALQLEVTGAASETVQWRATAFYRVV